MRVLVMLAYLLRMFVVKPDELITAIERDIRTIRSGTGYGHILITFRLDRPADVEAAMIKRPEAA